MEKSKLEKVEKTQKAKGAQRAHLTEKQKSHNSSGKVQAHESAGKTKTGKKNGKTVIVKYPGFFWRFLMIFILVIMLSVIIFTGVRKFTAVKKEHRVALVERQLNFCSELVSCKYRYSDVISLKKKSGFARSYSIVKYSGIIRAGIEDIGDIKYEVDSGNKAIFLKVPPAVLLGNEICSQEVFDEKQSIFVPITASEIFQEIEEAKVEAVTGIIEDGFLEESWEQACTVIRQFMYSCGFKEVHVEKM